MLKKTPPRGVPIFYLFVEEFEKVLDGIWGNFLGYLGGVWEYVCGILDGFRDQKGGKTRGEKTN